MLAANFVVNTTLDTVDVNPGDGIAADAQGNTSLRAAIMEANALSGNDTITLPAGTYTLTRSGAADDTAVNGDLDITDNLIIAGAGSGETIIDAGGDSGIGERIFEIPEGTGLRVDFHAMTLTGGRALGQSFPDNRGGAIRIDFFHEILITDTAFIDNQAPFTNGSSSYGIGGAISSNGKLTITDSRFEDNYASNAGGAIEASGTVTGVPDGALLDIYNTTFTENRAQSSGGALRISVPTAIENTTFDHNVAAFLSGGGGQGGAIDLQNSTYGNMTIFNSTFSANEANFGGAISNFLNRSLDREFSIVSSTIVDNTGTAIYSTGTSIALSITNSIVANNTGRAAGRDVIGGVNSGGYNVIGDATGTSGFIGPFDQTGTAENPLDPLLSPLGDHGGSTFTHVPLVGSPAIDAGNLGLYPKIDQRGVARPQGAAADIGAAEREEVAPVAVDDTADTDANVAVVIPVTANDTDEDGDLLEVTQVTQGSHGTVTNNTDGTVTYTPANGYEGQDSFTYTISDGTGSNDVGTVLVQVGPVRTPPVAVDDHYTTAEDTSLTVLSDAVFNLDQANDRELGLYQFNASFLNLQQPVVAGSSGKLESVDIYIGEFSDVGAVVSFFVSAGAPWQTGAKAFEIEYTLTEADIDNWLTIDVSAADIMLSAGETFTIGTAENTFPSVFLMATNSDYENGDNYVPGSLYVEGAVEITPGLNDYDLLFRTRMETSREDVALLANDYDPDGDPLTASLATQASHGTVVMEEDGTFTYTPNANFFGEDSFTYIVNDGFGGTDTATVTITVTPENDPPTPTNDSDTTNEDTAVVIDVLANDTDIDGDTLQVTQVSAPTHGVAVLNADQTVTYTPFANYSGSDSFSYYVSDGTASPQMATVSLYVVPMNDPPVAHNDVLVVDEDTQISINVLDNDTDIDGASLQVIASTTPQHGVAILDDSGALTYVPNADFYGTDSFTYTVGDMRGGSSIGTVQITVNPINDAPVAVDDNVTTAEDTPISMDLLANDLDVDGDTLSIEQIGTPSNLFVQDNGDGTITVTPQNNFTGENRFSYRITDGNSVSQWAYITVTITPVNDPPFGGFDIVTTAEDTPLVIPVLDNDSDVDGDTLSVASIGEVTNGTAVLNADGTITYTPNPNFNGYDTFSYVVSDGHGGTANSSITVTVTPTNDPPVAVDDTLDFLEDHGYLLHLVENDIDIDGDELTVTFVSSPDHGRTEERAAGWIYLPDLNFNGTETLTYEISDGHGGTDTGTITINVAPVNDAPTATEDEASTDEDTSVEIDVLLNDTDIDGDALNVSAVSTPDHGTTEVTAQGTIRYTPDANFHGTDSFTYTISDGNGKTATATVVLSVAPINDPPTPHDDTVETNQDTAVTISVLANDSDIDGNPLTITATTDPAHGTLQVNDDGTITYTPDALVTGTDSFTYTIGDGLGAEGTATVYVTIADTTNSSLVSVTLTRQGITPAANETNSVVPFFHEWQPVSGHVWLDIEEAFSDSPVEIVVHLTSSSTYFIDPEIASHLGTSATVESTTEGESRLTTLTLTGVDLSSNIIGDRVLIGTLLFEPDASDPAGLSANTSGQYAQWTSDIGFQVEDAAIVDGSTLEVEPSVAGLLGPVIYDHNEDGRVGLSDFAEFVKAFGKSANEANPASYRFDYDRNGLVTLSDFAYFVRYFGYAKSSAKDINMPGLSDPLPLDNNSSNQLEAEFILPSFLEGEPISASPQTVGIDLLTVAQTSDAVLGLASTVSNSQPEQTGLVDLLDDTESLTELALPQAASAGDDAFDPRLIDALCSDDNFVEASSRLFSEEDSWEEVFAALGDDDPLGNAGDQ